jgi:hypothetical protein
MTIILVIGHLLEEPPKDPGREQLVGKQLAQPQDLLLREPPGIVLPSKARA